MVISKCLSAFFDKYKDEYTSLLFQVSTQGNWLDWLDFCLRGTIEQSKDSVTRFEALLKLRNEYMTLLGEQGGSIRLNKLIEHLFKTPVIFVSYHAKMCNVAYNTARQDINRLVQVGILTASENNKRPRYFFALGIIDIIFD